MTATKPTFDGPGPQKDDPSARRTSLGTRCRSTVRLFSNPRGLNNIPGVTLFSSLRASYGAHGELAQPCGCQRMGTAMTPKKTKTLTELVRNAEAARWARPYGPLSMDSGSRSYRIIRVIGTMGNRGSHKGVCRWKAKITSAPAAVLGSSFRHTYDPSLSGDNMAATAWSFLE